MNSGTLVLAAALSGSLWLGYAQTLSLENTALPIGDGRAEWTLYVSGNPSEIQNIKCVEYRFPSNFPDPIKAVCEKGDDPNKAFALNGSGWTAFNVDAMVKFASKPPMKLSRQVNLTPPSRPQICPIAATQTVAEGEAWTLSPPNENIHIYVNEIHHEVSHLDIINTSKAFNSTNVDWSNLRRGLHDVGNGKLISNSYRVLDRVHPERRVSIPLDGAKLDFFVDYPSRHSTLEIDICKE